MRIASLVTLIALLSLTAAQAATTYTVTSTADSGPGTLRTVIGTLNADTGENVFTIAFNVGSNQTIAVNSNLSAIGRSGTIVAIDGAGSPGLRIDGQGTARLLFSSRNALFNVRDLALARGSAAGGGCLRSGSTGENGSPMIVTRVLFSDCVGSTEGGGAIYATSQLNVTDSVFLDNRVNGISGIAAGGGAIAKSGAGNLIVEGSAFIDNRVVGDGGTNASMLGGAIYIADSSLSHSVRSSWFSGNRALNPGGAIGGYGGAIHLERGGLGVERSFFRGNHADREGGSISVAAFAGPSATRALRLRNSSFESNTAPTGGAIMFANYGNQNGVLDIRNSLFQLNRADTSLGHSIYILSGAGSMNLSHTAFGARGVAGTSPGTHCAGGTATTHNANAVLQGNSLGCSATATTFSTLGLVGTEPALPADFPVAYAIAPTRPLNDAGAAGAGSIADPSACLTSDAASVLRPQSGIYGGPIRCDIGPVEFIGPMFRDGFEG